MQKSVAWIVSACAVAIALALGIRTWQDARRNAAPALTTPYQAVLLVNGQAFFARVENLDTEHPVLHDVFYIQSRTNPETKQVANVLVKRGQEWHGPDRMIINKRHLLLIEPVKEDSQVAKLIAEQAKQPR